MTDAELTFEGTSETDTGRLGRALAEHLVPGTVVALCGTLGAGKTRLVQSVAEASGVDRRDVVSPTFVLVHEYRGARPIYHLDAYRLRDEDEFVELGASEYFVAPNLVFVEWADRVARCLPSERLEITIEVLAGEARKFHIRGHGSQCAATVDRLGAALTG